MEMEVDEVEAEAEAGEEGASVADAVSGLQRSPRRPARRNREQPEEDPDEWLDGLDYDEYVEIMTAMEEALFEDIRAQETAEYAEFCDPEAEMADEFDSFVRSCQEDAVPCPVCRRGYLQVDSSGGGGNLYPPTGPTVRCACGQINFRVQRHPGPFGPAILRGLISAAVDNHSIHCHRNPRIFQPQPLVDPPRLARLPPGLYLECEGCLAQKIILQ